MISPCVARFHAATFLSRVAVAVRPYLPKACHSGSEFLQSGAKEVFARKKGLI